MPLVFSVHAAAAVAAAKETCDRATLLDAAARGVAVCVRRHLARKPGTKRPGFPHTGYWRSAAESVQTRVSGSEAIVSIHAPGIAMKLSGGVIRPARGKALAIPARPEVAGIWPSEYAGSSYARGASGTSSLFGVWRRGARAGVLAARESSGRLRVLWFLVAKATVRPDPSVLPSRQELEEAASSAASDAIDALAAERGLA